MLATGQVPGQQSGGPGLPADEFGPAAFAGDDSPPAGHVQVGDVEGEDFAGPGRALIQQPPQGLVPQRVFRGQEGEQLVGGDGAATGVRLPVESLPVSFQAHGR